MHGIQDMYRIVQQNEDSATYFIEIINNLKKKNLLAIQSERQSQTQRAESRDEKSEAADVLQVGLASSKVRQVYTW